MQRASVTSWFFVTSRSAGHYASAAACVFGVAGSLEDWGSNNNSSGGEGRSAAPRLTRVGYPRLLIVAFEVRRVA